MKPLLSRDNIMSIGAGTLIFYGLYLTSLYRYILFHSLAELFSIVVIFGIFIMAWNARRFLDNNYILLVGIAYLFVGMLDLLHTLAYQGMGVFPEYGPNLAPQLWIASRYIESITLLIAPFFIRRKLRANLAFVVYGVVTGLLLASIFYWQNFPVCFVQGVGLTAFKVISEYIICLILVAALGLMLWKRRAFDHNVILLLALSMVARLGMELSFTAYVGMYDFSNLVGHLFKIAAFYLLYRALIQTGFVKPQDLLFHNLAQSKAHLEVMFAERTAELQQELSERKRAEEVLQRKETELSEAQRLVHIGNWYWDAQTDATTGSDELLRIFGLDPVTQSMPKFSDQKGLLYPAESWERVNAAVQETLQTGVGYELDVVALRADGTSIWITTRSEVVRDANSQIIGLRGTVQNITERKQAEEKIRKLNLQLEQRIEERTLELHESESRFRVLFNSGSDAIFVQKVSGDSTLSNFVEVNDIACKRLGYSRDELLQMSPADIDAPDARANISVHTQKILQDGMLLVESAHMTKDGRRIPVEISAQRFLLSEIPMIIAVARDISERKAAEAKLLESHELLQKRSAELEMFNKAMVGREQRIIEMKENINALCRELGREPQYPPVWRKGEES